MKQRALQRRLEKLNLKFAKTKTELAAAKRRASSTRLAARNARRAQRAAKKSAQAARDAARVADSVLTKAERAFSKASARLDKLQKKLLKAKKTATAQIGQSAKVRKPAKPRRVPVPPFPISGDKTSAPAIARATAAAAKRGAFLQPPERRAIPARPITTVAPLPEAHIAAAG